MSTAGNRSSLRVQQLLTKAKKAERRGKPHDCADACRRILAEQPDHPKALSLLGHSALQIGDFRVGIEALLQAVAVNPANVKAFINLGKALTHVGNLAEAEKAFQGALAADPADADAHLNYAIILEIGGRLSEAGEHYLIVTQKRPKIAEAWLGLGNTQKAGGCLAEARESFVRAIALRPKFASAHHNLGSTLLELESYEAAIAAFRRAIDLEAGRADSWYNLGLALHWSGDHDDAVDALEKSLDLAPEDIDALNSLVSALCILIRHQEAIEYCRRIIRIKPESAEAHISLGRCFSVIGRTDESSVAFETALHLAETTTLRVEALCNLSALPDSTLSIDLLTSIENLSKGELGSLNTEEADSFRTRLAFARAQGLDKTGCHEEAWQVLVDANRCLNASCEQGHERGLKENEDALLAASNWKGQEGKTDFDLANSPMSLFILGPSRSGKSTLEKLVGGLDGVKCGYESTILDNSIFQVSRTVDPSNLTRPGQLPDELSSKVSEIYLRTLRSRAGQASIYTNTYPGHILEVGPMSVNIPSTRFIFVGRNQEDTALRIFMVQYLEDTNHHAYQIDNIFNYLSWYQHMADIWMEKLPKTTMALSYEDLVAGPKETLAKVAEFCCLPPPTGNPLDPGDDRGCAGPYLNFLNDARS